MRIWQFERKNHMKPTVWKDAGLWWASVYDIAGNYHCDMAFTHSAALDQAYEYAAMNRAAQALQSLGEAA